MATRTAKKDTGANLGFEAKLWQILAQERIAKDYARPGLDKQRLGQIINLVSDIAFATTPVLGGGSATDRAKDTLGRVYEYFLARFASAEGKSGGQFYTPSRVVRMLVEMLAPYKGRVYDPCCGSGGMFVSSEKFIEAHSGKLGDISIYGQESNYTTTALLPDANSGVPLVPRTQQEERPLPRPARRDAFHRRAQDGLDGGSHSPRTDRRRPRAIWVVSRADAEYPRRLKTRLKKDAPPVLYGCGDAALLDTGGLAVVGSRDVDERVVEYAQGIGQLVARAKHTLVSGGARGIDQAAMRGALESGGKVAGVLVAATVEGRRARKAL